MNISDGGDPNPPKEPAKPPQETVERPPGRERPENHEYNKQIDKYWKDLGVPRGD